MIIQHFEKLKFSLWKPFPIHGTLTDNLSKRTYLCSANICVSYENTSRWARSRNGRVVETDNQISNPESDSYKLLKVPLTLFDYLVTRTLYQILDDHPIFRRIELLAFRSFHLLARYLKVQKSSSLKMSFSSSLRYVQLTGTRFIGLR